MKSMKHVHIICAALALIVMAIPWSVNYVHTDMSTTGVAQELVEHYAHYATEPFLKGYVGPFLTLVLTGLLTLILAFSYLTDADKFIGVTATALSSAALLTSFLPFVMGGVKGLTTAGVTVSFLLICSLVLSVQRLTGRYFQNYEDDDE